MKFFKTFFVLGLVALMYTSCKNNNQPEVKTISLEETNAVSSKELDPNASYAKVEFGIEGMTCKMGCAKTIEKKMAKMEGVKSATVDFDKRLAMVEYDEAKVSPKSLEEAVSAAGEVYKVKDMKVVETFEGEKPKSKKDCSKKDCCKDKKQGKEMASAEPCEKACCADKKKA